MAKGQREQGDETMQTYWHVEQVTEKPGFVEAELRQVHWFKKNPDRTAIDTEYDAYLAEHGEEATEKKYLGIEWPEEFIDTGPSDDADFIDAHGRLTLDITDGPELHAGDHIGLTVSHLGLVDA